MIHFFRTNECERLLLEIHLCRFFIFFYFGGGTHLLTEMEVLSLFTSLLVINEKRVTATFTGSRHSPTWGTPPRDPPPGTPLLHSPCFLLLLTIPLRLSF